MSFYSNNVFSGAGYSCARRNTALVKGTEASAEQGALTLAAAISESDAILVGAGAGLSTAAGLTYSGKRFNENFADFRDGYGITDMYSGGFYPFLDARTYWAWWSRHICINRYDVEPGKPYLELLELLNDKDYFVITTNVDHQFQLAGFDKARLFYTQGDYGLFQCSRNCSNKTHDNEEQVRQMVAAQKGMKIPEALLPTCPNCGSPLVPNLRIDGHFCEDEGWHMACERYQAFKEMHASGKVLYLELGVGGNTPAIIKYPFWSAVEANCEATYACVNMGEACSPSIIADRSILIDDDIGKFVSTSLHERRSRRAQEVFSCT